MNRQTGSTHREEFEKNGFVIYRNVIDPALIAEARQHIEWLQKRYPDLRPEHFHHPLMRDDAFWARLVTDPRILDIAEAYVGANMACFTSHYICKPPGDGHAVLWHQDAAYWKLEPMSAISLWLAVDESTPENGCVRMIPGTHKLPVLGIKLRRDVPNMLSSSVDGFEINEADAVDVVLNPGDVSVHSPLIIHGSEPNRSTKRRCGLDMGFIPTSTRITSEGVYLDPLLLRGTAVPGINKYRAWPRYHPDRSMDFSTRPQWDAALPESSDMNPAADEDVFAITKRVMERLEVGELRK